MFVCVKFAVCVCEVVGLRVDVCLCVSVFAFFLYTAMFSFVWCRIKVFETV